MDGSGALFEPLLHVLSREILPLVVRYPTQTFLNLTPTEFAATVRTNEGSKEAISSS
jgi:hypothetical protein